MTRHTYEMHENLGYGEPVPDCTCSEMILFYVPCLSGSYLINEVRPFNFYGKFCGILGDCCHNLSDISQFKKSNGLSKFI
jgi:hypothetical protein